MKQKQIILRAAPTRKGDGRFLGTARATTTRKATGLRVDVDEIDSRELGGVVRDLDVVAVAPAMPVRLIKPLKSKAKQAHTDWGIRAVGADQSPFTGDGIVVAVLDTGIDRDHPAFKGVTIVPRNFTSDADGDLDGHGTHCAGTIFGRDVNGTRIGVARGVRKALIGKVIGEDGAASDQIVQAIQWASNEGANVISMSLGLDFPGFQRELEEQLGLPKEIATSRALEGYRLNVLLFERLASTVRAMSGITGIASILIAAAGNESQTDVNPDFKIAVSPPAVSEGIISVAALGESPHGFVVASFSNTGALVSGPGVDITSALPADQGGGLTVSSGTSMAAPHVAGVAALWAEKMKAGGALTPTLLSNRLVGSGSHTGLKAEFDPADVGSGMVTAPLK